MRAGFIGMKTGKSNDTDKTDDVISNFYSPSIGFQLEDLKIGKTEFTFNYDYYIGHLYYSDITSAMGVGANLAIPFTTIDQIKLTFNVGVKDKIFVKDNSLENRANIILAIGAENVNR